LANIEDSNHLPQRGAGNQNLQLFNVNELETIFSNPKADILVFHRDITKDSVTAQFMYD
jgi:hypothetical protein